jgi:hypothetical protein
LAKNKELPLDILEKMKEFSSEFSSKCINSERSLDISD